MALSSVASSPEVLVLYRSGFLHVACWPISLIGKAISCAGLWPRPIPDQNMKKLALLAGHKKDLVLTRRLVGRPDRVAIYDWHRLDGRPIHPLSML